MKKILIIIMLLLLTGCRDYHELQDLGIVSSIYIDYDNEYKVDVEISNDESSKHFKGHGINLDDALNNTLENTFKFLYYNHMDAIILTPRVPIDQTLQYLARNPNINNTFYVIISDDEEILKIKQTGKTLKSIANRYDYDTFFEVTKNIYDLKKDFVLPNYKDGYIDSLALVKNNQIFSYLDNNQIQIYRMLMGKTDSYITGSIKNKDYTVTINEVKIKYDIKDKITLNITLSLAISEFNCDIDLLKNEDIKKFQSITEKNIKEEIVKFIDYLKDNETDILNINNRIINKKKNIDEVFYKYDFNVNVKSNINKKGLILK